MKPLAILPALILAASGTAFAAMHHAPKSHMPSCKGGTVYAVASTRIYYEKGETMYGHAKGGKYMCMAAANGQGYHHWTPKKTKKRHKGA